MSPDLSSPSEADSLARLRPWMAPRLLDWFALHRRDLPWRHDRDPYHIWVSEVMLQQTQVTTVIPYFARFLARFPTLADLAAASEQDVLRLWEGLGYYRRARDLLRAAQLLNKTFQGQFPDSVEALRDVPGFGEYTRNAVLSQAFDLPLPILEANSQRVLSRLFARSDDPRQGPARKWLWRAAETLLPAKGVGDFNQALMELGALVCTPTAPACGECPLAQECAARRLGNPEAFPARTPRPAVTQVREAAVAIRRACGLVLLVQRPASATRWANLWELPHDELAEGESAQTAAQRIIRSTGLQAELGPELTTIKHSVTRYCITLSCYSARHDAGEFASQFYAAAEWVEPVRLAEYPVSSPQRRLAKLLARPDAGSISAITDKRRVE